jgi:hypothetical protein
MDFTIFYKKSCTSDEFRCEEQYDFFFAADDGSLRTKGIIDKINAKEKYWITFPHYDLQQLQTEPSEVKFYSSDNKREDDFFENLWKNLADSITSSTKICIDMTGFIKPHLFFLIRYFERRGIKSFDCLYSEPQNYREAEETRFTREIDEEVRPIESFTSSQPTSSTENDLLIICGGYDADSMTKIFIKKGKIPHVEYILGLPSLQADMYQESALRAWEVVELRKVNPKFASAFDPFVTAEVIKEIVQSHTPSNIYLCPLSTKPQALGMVLYYLWNQNASVTILFPFSSSYASNTAEGIKRIWKYTIELP